MTNNSQTPTRNPQKIQWNNSDIADVALFAALALIDHLTKSGRLTLHNHLTDCLKLTVPRTDTNTVEIWSSAKLVLKIDLGSEAEHSGFKAELLPGPWMGELLTYFNQEVPKDTKIDFLMMLKPGFAAMLSVAWNVEL